MFIDPRSNTVTEAPAASAPSAKAAASAAVLPFLLGLPFKIMIRFPILHIPFLHQTEGRVSLR